MSALHEPLDTNFPNGLDSGQARALFNELAATRKALDFWNQPSTSIIQYSDTYDCDATDKVETAYTTHKKTYGINADRQPLHPINNSLEGAVAASEMLNGSQRPERLILAINYAPAEKKNGTRRNARKDFYGAVLKNGDQTTIIATLNGFEFSYVRDRIEFFGRFTRTNEIGSQFRSYEFMPQHSLRLALPEERETMIRSGELEPLNDLDDVAAVPNETFVFQEDNFGNEKLHLSEPDNYALHKIAAYNRNKAPEDKLSVKLVFGRESIEFTPDPKPGILRYALPSLGVHSAIVSDHLFDAGFGKNVLALESSSTVFGESVPILAKIRRRPAETPSGFGHRKVGQPIFIAYPAIPGL